MKKLSLNKIFFISEVVLIPIVLFGTYLVLGTERSYSVLVDIMPYGGAYVAWLVYQSEYEIAPLPLYPISRINRIIGRIKNVCFAVLGSFIMYMLFSSFLHLFNPIDLISDEKFEKINSNQSCFILHSRWLSCDYSRYISTNNDCSIHNGFLYLLDVSSNCQEKIMSESSARSFFFLNVVITSIIWDR